MNVIKKVIKKVIGREEKPTISFSGHYSSFSEALAQTTSYNASDIMQKAEKTAKEFKSDKGSLDTALGATLSQYGALFSLLTRIAWDNSGRLNVVDFGGSNGYFYFQVKNFLGDRVRLKWSVVELGGVVEIGNKYYANNELGFTSDYDSLIKATVPDVLLVSGTVQYLEDPEAFIKKWIADGFQYIIFDRTPLTHDVAHVKIQQVRKPIYDATFPIHIMNYKKFVAQFAPNYELLFDFPSYDKEVAGVSAVGLVFRKKSNA